MRSAGDPIEVEYDFQDLPMRALLQRVQSFHRPNRAVQVLISVTGWFVLMLGIFGIAQLWNGHPMTGTEYAIIGFSAGMVGTVLVLALVTRLVLRSQMTALLSARSRQGRVRIVLSANGIEYSARGVSSHQSWENIQEMVVAKDVTMIMPSRTEFYPVPHKSLPADVSPEDLDAIIAVWRNTSKEVT